MREVTLCLVNLIDFAFDMCLAKAECSKAEREVSRKMELNS